ncbi:MAG: hypothetical protein JSV78_02060 [Phycisphaerales bacterium]|nr:MAG: hypothetical protein JSV78_02060 [Phycisphaerales bacterium]
MTSRVASVDRIIHRIPSHGAAKRRIGSWFALALVAMFISPVAAGQPKVTVEGGSDASGHNYAWTITNHHNVPITRISFPHFGADVMRGPDGWQSSCTNAVRVGVSDPTGVCTAMVEGVHGGIKPRSSGKFTLRVARPDAKASAGEMEIIFADRSTYVVSGVELPHAEPLGDKYMPLMGLGGIFLIFLLVSALRHWAKKDQRPATTEEGSPPGAP